MQVRDLRWLVLAVLSALFIFLLIGISFVGAYIATSVTRGLALLFICSITSLTDCLLLFFREVMLAGRALKHNIRTKRGA